MLKAELSMKIKVVTFGGIFGFLLCDSSVSGQRLASFLGLTSVLGRTVLPQNAKTLDFSHPREHPQWWGWWWVTFFFFFSKVFLFKNYFLYFNIYIYYFKVM